MSSCYTQAQLEEMRRQELKKEVLDKLDSEVSKVQTKLLAEHESVVQTVSSSHHTPTVSVEDDEAEDCDDVVSVTAESVKAVKGKAKASAEHDFSSLLSSKHKKPTKMEEELSSLVKKIDERPVMSEKDAKDRDRVVAEVTKILADPDMDIEDKLNSVRMRVFAYLQSGVQLSDAEKDRIEENYCRYCVLCEMLGTEPTEIYPYRVEQEIERMTEILVKRREDEYVLEVIDDILKELGVTVKADAVLDHTEGQIYSVEGHPLCDVFIGCDGMGIMFEPIAASKEVSEDRRRQTERSAGSICALYDIIEQRAAERGVILKRVYSEPAQIDKMCERSDVTEKKEKKKRKKVSPKERAEKTED